MFSILFRTGPTVSRIKNPAKEKLHDSQGLLFLVGSADLYPPFKYNYVFPKIHDALPNTGIP